MPILTAEEKAKIAFAEKFLNTLKESQPEEWKPGDGLARFQPSAPVLTQAELNDLINNIKQAGDESEIWAVLAEHIPALIALIIRRAV